MCLSTITWAHLGGLQEFDQVPYRTVSTLLQFYIATLLHCYTATLLHCYIGGGGPAINGDLYDLYKISSENGYGRDGRFLTIDLAKLKNVTKVYL